MTKLLPCIEWADALALKPIDLSPERRAALEAHLATCPGCAATYADYQMLITRLRALPRPALLPLEPLTLDDFDEPDAQNHAYDTIETLLPPPERIGPPTRLPARWRRGWSQRLSLVAAVLLLTVLVGSMALLFHRSPSPPASDTPFRLRPGWTQLAEYSGVGSQTINAQDIDLPRMYGYAYGCVGSGKLTIKINSLRTNSIWDIGSDKCNTALPITSPNTFSFDNTAAGTLDTITVTADAHTRWFFQFTAAPQQPTLTLGTEWTQQSGGSGQVSTAYHDETSSYKTWGIVFICFGTGNAYFTFTPDVGKLMLPACDGQPHFKVVHFSAPHIFDAALTVTGNILWSFTSFGCTNEEQCAAD
jgi:hypothetical protein